MNKRNAAGEARPGGERDCSPWRLMVDQVLRAVDARLAEAGASGGSKAQGHKVKSKREDLHPLGGGGGLPWLEHAIQEVPASKVLG